MSPRCPATRRAAKTKTNITIHRAAAAGRSNPSDNPSDLNIARLNELATRLEGYESGLNEVRTAIQENQTASRQANFETLNQIMERLDSLGTTHGPAHTDVQMPVIPTDTSSPSTAAVNVRARWSWINTSTADSIVNGSFEINNLTKLHREESLRNCHNPKTFENWVIPLDGSKPEYISGRTKMQSAFRDLSTFLSAWLIYIYIRASYQPERGPGLSAWTERLIFLSRCEYPWSTVLQYAIAYYSDHQNSPPEAWFKVDGELIANHFGIAKQRTMSQGSIGTFIQTVSPNEESKNPQSSSQSSFKLSNIPNHLQTCTLYSRNVCSIPSSFSYSNPFTRGS
jgi:hypothetical protein